MSDRRYTLRLHADDPTEAAVATHLDGLRSGRRAEILRRLIVAGWQAQQGAPRAPVTAPAYATAAPVTAAPQPTPAPAPRRSRPASEQTRSLSLRLRPPTTQTPTPTTRWRACAPSSASAAGPTNPLAGGLIIQGVAPPRAPNRESKMNRNLIAATLAASIAATASVAEAADATDVYLPPVGWSNPSAYDGYDARSFSASSSGYYYQSARDRRLIPLRSGICTLASGRGGSVYRRSGYWWLSAGYSEALGQAATATAACYRN